MVVVLDHADLTVAVKYTLFQQARKDSFNISGKDVVHNRGSSIERFPSVRHRNDCT